jgi:hypothetical protein
MVTAEVEKAVDVGAFLLAFVKILYFLFFLIKMSVTFILIQLFPASPAPISPDLSRAIFKKSGITLRSSKMTAARSNYVSVKIN